MASNKSSKSLRLRFLGFVKRKKRRNRGLGYGEEELDSVPVLESIDESAELVQSDDELPGTSTYFNTSGGSNVIPEIKGNSSTRIAEEDFTTSTAEKMDHRQSKGIKQELEIGKHDCEDVKSFSALQDEKKDNLERSSGSTLPDEETTPDDEIVFLKMPDETKEYTAFEAKDNEKIDNDVVKFIAANPEKFQNRNSANTMELFSMNDIREHSGASNVLPQQTIKKRIVRFQGMSSCSSIGEVDTSPDSIGKCSSTHDPLQNIRDDQDKQNLVTGKNVFEVARQSSLRSEGEVDIIFVDEVEAVSFSRQASSTGPNLGMVSRHSDVSDDIFVDIFKPVFPEIKNLKFQGVDKTDFIFQDTSKPKSKSSGLLHEDSSNTEWAEDSDAYNSITNSNDVMNSNHSDYPNGKFSQSCEETADHSISKRNSVGSLSTCTLGSETNLSSSSSKSINGNRSISDVSVPKDSLFIVSKYLKRVWDNDSELESIIKMLYKWGKYNVVIDGVLNTFYAEDHIYFYLSDYKAQQPLSSNTTVDPLKSVFDEVNDINANFMERQSLNDDCPVLEYLFSVFLDKYLSENVRSFTEKTLYCRHCQCIHVIDII